jgi:riboflavin biosynthesis pyrimidine reductase
LQPLPTLSLNFAISADGKIAPAGGSCGRWTSAADHDRLLQLRLDADALLVGRGTLDADRMTLTLPARLDPPRQPLRCIVSRRGRLDPGHPLFTTPGGPIHLLVTGPDAPPAELAAVATIHRSPLTDFLATLHHDHGVRHVHCEGGGQLARALLELDLVATLHLTWAGHTVFGGHDAPTLTGLPGDFLPASRQFELAAFAPHQDLGECFLTYRRVRGD